VDLLVHRQPCESIDIKGLEEHFADTFLQIKLYWPDFNNGTKPTIVGREDNTNNKWGPFVVVTLYHHIANCTWKNLQWQLQVKFNVANMHINHHVCLRFNYFRVFFRSTPPTMRNNTTLNCRVQINLPILKLQESLDKMVKEASPKEKLEYIGSGLYYRPFESSFRELPEETLQTIALATMLHAKDALHELGDTLIKLSFINPITFPVQHDFYTEEEAKCLVTTIANNDNDNDNEEEEDKTGFWG
jgi:hypothetical protein